MITYTFDQNILYIKLIDNVKLEDIISYLSKFDEIDYLPENLLLLYDLTKANIKISPTEIKIISQVADVSTHGYKSTKTAFLVASPKITAYSSLFSNFSKNKQTQRKIFSSKDAAIKWLNHSSN